VKAVVTGATGATGKELLKLLLKDERITQVIALVRRSLNITHPKLQAAIVDFDNQQEWHSLVKGDVAFSCMGTTLKAAGSKAAQYKVDYEYQYAFAEAARQNDIPAFVLISAGMANPKSLVFYSRMKGELERAIQLLHFKSLVILRPGLLSRPDTDRSGEKVSEGMLNFFNKLGLFKNMAPLRVNKLAELMLHYAKQAPEGTHIVGSGRILKEIAEK